MIRALLLDLDNTLYPANAVMEAEIVRRMNEYVARYLGLPFDEAAALRRERMPAYATTYEWLAAEHGLADAEGYFDYVHPEGEEACLEPDPALGPLLDGIGLPKYIFTNAPASHADRVLERLGSAGRFRQIFDIRFNGLRGKPHASAVDRVLAAVRADCGAAPSEVAFVDDVPRYVRGFSARGGLGILIDHHGRHAAEGLPTIRLISELPSALAAAAEGIAR